MSVFVYKNKDSWFMTKTTIEYPDGCIEEFVNKELVDEECTRGRELAELQAQGKRVEFLVFRSSKLFLTHSS